VLFNFCLKANRGDAHDYTLEFGYYNVLQHSLRGCGKKFNARLTRRFGVAKRRKIGRCAADCYKSITMAGETPEQLIELPGFCRH